MDNFIQKGDSLTITATAAVASGDLVVAGSLIGVAATDAAIGETFALETTGVFLLPKVSGDVVTIGAPLYWNNTALTITPATGAKKLVGAAVAPAGSGTTTVRVKLGVHNITGPA